MDISVVWWVLGASGAIILASLSGLLFFATSLRVWAERNLHLLVSFAAGVFLVVATVLSQETFELTESPWIALIWIAVGAFFIHLTLRFIPESHHHHDPSEEAQHSIGSTRAILWGDAIHNIGDGLILVPAFLVGPEVGIATAIGIFVHEFVQEIAEFFVLRDAGYTTGQAILRNVAVACTLLIGAGIGLSVGHINEIEAPILGIAAGAFFYVVIWDILPRTVTQAQRDSSSGKFVAAAMLGIIVMLGLNELAGHAHEESTHIEENESEHVLDELDH